MRTMQAPKAEASPMAPFIGLLQFGTDSLARGAVTRRREAVSQALAPRTLSVLSRLLIVVHAVRYKATPYSTAQPSYCHLSPAPHLRAPVHSMAALPARVRACIDSLFIMVRAAQASPDSVGFG